MKCNEFEEIILLNKFEELDEEVKKEINSHMKSCEKCSTLFSKVTGLDIIMDKEAFPYKKKFNMAALKEKEKFEKVKREERQNAAIWIITLEIIVLSIFLLFKDSIFTFIKGFSNLGSGLMSINPVIGIITLSVIFLSILFIPTAFLKNN